MFPAFKTCIEKIPPALQNPEIFRYISRILLDVKHPGVQSRGLLSYLETSLRFSERLQDSRPCPVLLHEVKQEPDEMDGLYRNAQCEDYGFLKQWSLDGVEEFFIDPYEPKWSPEVDEKPLPHLLELTNLGVKTLDPHGKARSCIQTGCPTLKPTNGESNVKADIITCSFPLTNKDNGVHAKIEAPEDDPINSEPTVKANFTYSSPSITKYNGIHANIEAQQEESTLWMPSVRKLINLSKKFSRKRNTLRVAARWLKDEKLLKLWKSKFRHITNLKRNKKHKSSICEFNLQPVIKKNNLKITREANVILALPAVFSFEDILKAKMRKTGCIEKVQAINQKCYEQQVSSNSTSVDKEQDSSQEHNCQVIRDPGYADKKQEINRCQQTDGKRWRCSRMIVGDSRYCERHQQLWCSRIVMGSSRYFGHHHARENQQATNAQVMPLNDADW